MSAPAVSVLIPSYNHALYVAEAIESVLAQDFADFELLIVDDCSSDATAEVVQPFCQLDQRVHFAANPANLGMVENWNQCLDKARGQYIKFLFGDDKLSDPQALSKMISLLEKHPSAMLAASARTLLDEKSHVTDIVRPLPAGCHRGRKIIARCVMEDANLIGEPSAVLFRKEDAQRGFDPNLRQIVDLEMWFYLLEQGDLAYTREPLCAFRQHAQQQTVVNTTTGLARKEHALFFAGYATKPWLPRRFRFSRLFELRRARRKHPEQDNPAMRALEQRLSEQMGKGWYLFYWLGYKLARPFENLNHSVRKRLHLLSRALQR